MLVESIILAIFVISFGGVLLILIRKVPMLNSLSQNGGTSIREHKFILNIENKIKNVLLYFEKQIFLHKFLSWLKVMVMRIETRIDVLLHKIRKKAQQVDRNKPG